MKKCSAIVIIFLSVLIHKSFAQQDSLENERLAKMIQLGEVVVRNDLNIPKFVEQVRNDTTFYKAFKNLRVLNFTALNDIRMLDKKGKAKATLFSKTKQHVANGCRTMEKLSETATGDFYQDDGDYNYYTAELYAGLFFTNEPVCGETNIVKGTQRDVKDKSGMEKHKEQLKMLFFDPGKKVPGIPFMGDKTAIFDDDQSEHYDFFIDTADLNGQTCYKFVVAVKEDEKSSVVIDNMTTWFDANTLEIVARHYDLSYNAGVYDFDVHMEVQMTHFGNLLVPSTLRYNGTWDVAFKKKERGVFTATLFDFSR